MPRCIARARPPPRARTHAGTHTHTHIHTHAHGQNKQHVHAHMHTHTFTCTRTHARTSPVLFLPALDGENEVARCERVRQEAGAGESVRFGFDLGRVVANTLGGRAVTRPDVVQNHHGGAVEFLSTPRFGARGRLLAVLLLVYRHEPLLDGHVCVEVNTHQIDRARPTDRPDTCTRDAEALNFFEVLNGAVLELFQVGRGRVAPFAQSWGPRACNCDAVRVILRSRCGRARPL
mmetsp:Transcript_35148/g.60630  ORF Transcript_35148/g.60630 Transcript_35148/m.60630 type:complete len:233 (+) Transcript_35148:130-828(+)